tara:strand:+ start:1150 stop:1302 length:153 start_codon:yes stop_codon:yes gene_type:complete
MNKDYIKLAHSNFAATELPEPECKHNWVEEPKHIFTCSKCGMSSGLQKQR